MVLIKSDQHAILKAAQMILAGKIVAYPTESVYGLAALATNVEAVQLLKAIKGRGEKHPFPCLVANEEMLWELVTDISPKTKILMTRYWPGPLTLIFDGKKSLPLEVKGSDGTVGVRISSDPIAHLLVETVGHPITATSANLTGTPPATSAFDLKNLPVDLVLDDGLRNQKPSTLVDCRNEFKLLRAGALEIAPP